MLTFLIVFCSLMVVMNYLVAFKMDLEKAVRRNPELIFYASPVRTRQIAKKQMFFWLILEVIFLLVRFDFIS